MSRPNFAALLFGCTVLAEVLADAALSAKGPTGVAASAQSDNKQHCLSDGKGKGMLQYYRSVGVKTELRPFGTSATEARRRAAYDEIEPPLWEIWETTANPNRFLTTRVATTPYLLRTKSHPCLTVTASNRSSYFLRGGRRS